MKRNLSPTHTPGDEGSLQDFQANRFLFLWLGSRLMLALSGLTFGWYLFIFFWAGGQFRNAILNSVIGIIAFILIRHHKKAGVFLAIVWSVLQFISVQVSLFVFDFVQLIGISIPLENPLASGDLVQIKVNFLAILLFAIFVMNWDTFDFRKKAPLQASVRSAKKRR